MIGIKEIKKVLESLTPVEKDEWLLNSIADTVFSVEIDSADELKKYMMKDAQEAYDVLLEQDREDDREDEDGPQD